MSNDGTCIPEPVEQAGRRRALRGRDRLLVGALGLCRYLTIRQFIELGVGAKIEKRPGPSSVDWPARRQGPRCERRGRAVESPDCDRLA